MADETEALRAALEYYADHARWVTNSAGITPAMDDRGHRARAALATSTGIGLPEDDWLLRQLEAWPVRVDPDCTTNVEYLMKEAAKAIRAASEREAAAVRAEAWQPIETAPKDGTTIDVWREEGGRDTVHWGLPPHECGEMGAYCDSDWHRIKQPGWICSTFGEFVGGKHDPFTHWMPLPAPPATAIRSPDDE